MSEGIARRSPVEIAPDAGDTIGLYSGVPVARRWLETHAHRRPAFACILGFTATGSIPGISAAGATPKDRQTTAIADAEFLAKGVVPSYRYSLPPLTAGVSPAFISRSVVAALDIPCYLFNAGLPVVPSVATLDLGGKPANCLSSGQALPIATVRHLLAEGLEWGDRLARALPNSYLILSECVVGGTTTALALLTGLGISVGDRINSSHPQCNHAQKWQVVRAGLAAAGRSLAASNRDPCEVVAALGDPMQIAAAGMAIAASRRAGVLLAGGTQMLAVYALIRELNARQALGANLANVVVGTTRWVAEDPTGDAVGLAEDLGSIPLIATQLSFAESAYSQLQVYERGYVKEGVGAGGCAIAASLYRQWSQAQLLEAIEQLLAQWERRTTLAPTSKKTKSR